MSILRPIATVGGLTMVSRVLGFARDVLVASYLGAGPVADAFFVAFKFPNFFRRLFAEGAFNAAFVPMFAGRIAQAGHESARRFAEDTLAVLAAVVLAVVVLAQTFMPWVLALFAPGFVDEPEKFRLAVDFARVTFPYLLFISLVSLQGGVLNSIDRFGAVAAAPILLNISLIGALVALTPRLPSAGHALAWGVAIAGLAQFLWLTWAMHRAGMALALPWPRLTPEVKRLLRLMLPAALGSGVVQINLLIDVVIASLLPTGAISYLFYADRLYELPLAVIGIAIGTAILPLMARQLRGNETAAALATQSRGVEAGLLLSLPAAAGLIMLATPIIAVLFERGAFGPKEVEATAAALVAYACGLPAYVLIKVLAPGFYAREDTTTPVKIAVAAVAANTAIALVLMVPLKHVGIALATALSAWLNAGLLALLLRRRGHFMPSDELKRRLSRMAAAALGMAGAIYLARHGLGAASLEHWLAGGTLARTAALAILVMLGAGVYALLAQLFGAAQLSELRRLIQRG